MGLYIDDRPRPVHSPLLVALMAFNIVFACSVLWAWALVYMVLAEPIVWATSRSVGTSPDIFDYPFLLLWGLPILAVLIARASAMIGARQAAFVSALMPPGLFGAILIMFYLAPA